MAAKIGSAQLLATKNALQQRKLKLESKAILMSRDSDEVKVNFGNRWDPLSLEIQVLRESFVCFKFISHKWHIVKIKLC